MFGKPAEVEFHLAFVFRFEVAELEVDGDEAFQAAMVEEEVEVEVVGIDLDAGLASEEGEAAAEFEEEGFEFAQDGVLEVFLEVAVFEAEEVEDVGIAEDEVRGELVLAAEGGEFSPGDFFGLLGNSGALVEHGVDLVAQGAGAPALNAAHLGVEVALECIRQRENVPKVGPTQLCTQ